MVHMLEQIFVQTLVISKDNWIIIWKDEKCQGYFCFLNSDRFWDRLFFQYKKELCFFFHLFFFLNHLNIYKFQLEDSMIKFLFYFISIRFSKLKYKNPQHKHHSQLGLQQYAHQWHTNKTTPILASFLFFVLNLKVLLKKMNKLIVERG